MPAAPRARVRASRAADASAAPAAADPGAGAEAPDADPAPVNEVRLSGRLAAPVDERVLPSGDTVATFRLVVARSGPVRPGAPSVDTVDCAAWTARQRRRLVVLPAGSVLSVQGSLRRRFYRAGGAVASRYEVEVADLAVLSRPAVPRRPRAAAAPDPSPASA